MECNDKDINRTWDATPASLVEPQPQPEITTTEPQIVLVGDDRVTNYSRKKHPVKKRPKSVSPSPVRIKIEKTEEMIDVDDAGRLAAGLEIESASGSCFPGLSISDLDALASMLTFQICLFTVVITTLSRVRQKTTMM